MQASVQELTARERSILHSIVRAYIDTGEPIGSRTISRLDRLSLSPATIRNVMADLAENGYLAQPHTSAGRIPTEKAYRDFAGAASRARCLIPIDVQARCSRAKLLKNGSQSLPAYSRRSPATWESPRPCPLPHRNWNMSS